MNWPRGMKKLSYCPSDIRISGRACMLSFRQNKGKCMKLESLCDINSLRSEIETTGKRDHTNNDLLVETG